MRFTRVQIQFVIGLITFILLIAFIYFFYIFISFRIIDSAENEAQNRSALFAGAIRGDLQRHLIVPRILSRDTKVSNALVKQDKSLDQDFSRTVEELDRATLYLVSRSGFIVNSSDERLKNTSFRYPESWPLALEAGNVNFFDTARQVFVTISRVEDDKISTPLGIIVMEVSFALYPVLWDRSDVDMMMIRNDGMVLASRYPDDVGANLRDLIQRPFDFDLLDVQFDQSYPYHGQGSYLHITDLGINRWSLVYAYPSTQARQAISGLVALMVFVIAFLFLFVSYLFSRRSARQSVRLKRESEELRALNARLINEVEQRRKAEANLQSAEQSLEQSSKLAVIGQLSAAVGHELNQPLAAMRTYLSSVRVLLRRSRFFEAAQNLNRIDDLVDRMSGITRQMRSFASAHENEIAKFDLNTAVINAFQLMIPQLGQSEIEVDRHIPLKKIFVQGDMLRAEQILVNIMRNALEAVASEDDPRIEIKLEETDHEARVTISDNGPGIAQPDQLFEPFYTTKNAGEGLGLGLAISASYAKDMGGNLLARNSGLKGAIFELILPKAKD